MKRLLILFVLFFFANVPSALSTETIMYNPDRIDHSSFVGYHPKKIVVKFDPSMMSRMDKRGFAKGKTGVPTLDLIGERYKVRVIQKQFRKAKINKSKGRAVDLSGWHRIKFDKEIDVLSVVEEYKAIPGVVRAEPVSIHKIYADPEPMVPVEEFFDDKYSWHLKKIKADIAWNYETGNDNIIVAILDTGVRYFHGDLGGSGASYYNPTNVSGNMWVNSEEKDGTSGVDDDGNGYVDDWIGYDFVENVSTLGAPCHNEEDCSMSDNDPRDFNGHGTHCAGLVAAITNNNYGIPSVAGGWGDGSHEPQPSEPGVKIMALRVGWSDEPLFPCSWVGYYPMAGYVEMDYAAEALAYAADKGARIASCSWGSENAGGIYDAIAYFVASGGLIFKAAGNANNSVPDFMEDLPVHPDLGDLNPYVISVAATDINDCKASFSSYGDWVDISAPGEEYVNPYGTGTGIWSLLHNHCEPAGEFITHMEGTSMATPLAAAVAALIWSQNPGWTASQVIQQLYGSADDIYGLSCNSSYVGKLGAGRINAFNAVKIDCVDEDGDDFTTCDGDCNDDNANVNPEVPEICNNIDDNCDGQIDEDVTVTFYSDFDGDGFGDPANLIAACSASAGYVADNTDCDDSNANINPLSLEDCSDGVDNDCDILTDCDDIDCSGHTACIPECIPNKRWCDCDGQCGKWESTETCPWDCPSGCASNADCNDGEDCTLDNCIGGQCSSMWPACGASDGCCGPDCTSDTDSDCVISPCIPTPDCNCNGKCGKKEDKVNCPDCW